jgi:hypothetical protein
MQEQWEEKKASTKDELFGDVVHTMFGLFLNGGITDTKKKWYSKKNCCFSLHYYNNMLISIGSVWKHIFNETLKDSGFTQTNFHSH